MKPGLAGNVITTHWDSWQRFATRDPQWPAPLLPLAVSDLPAWPRHSCNGDASSTNRTESCWSLLSGRTPAGWDTCLPAMYVDKNLFTNTYPLGHELLFQAKFKRMNRLDKTGLLGRLRYWVYHFSIKWLYINFLQNTNNSIPKAKIKISWKSSNYNATLVIQSCISTLIRKTYCWQSHSKSVFSFVCH